jgi:hypothetical protein
MSPAATHRTAPCPAGHASLHIGVLLLLLLGLATAPAAAPGASVSGIAGYDTYSGPGGETTRSLIGGVTAERDPLSGLALLTRFDDSVQGKGVGLTGGLGVAAGARVALHAFATRYIGDTTYRAWRWKVGPIFALPGSRTLGLYFLHYSDDSSATSSAFTAEFAASLRENLTGRASGSYGSWDGQGQGQASLGLTWDAVKHLELAADVGLAQSGAGALGAFPSRKPKGGPSRGPGGGGAVPAASSGNPVSGTAELAARVTFP